MSEWVEEGNDCGKESVDAGSGYWKVPCATGSLLSTYKIEEALDHIATEIVAPGWTTVPIDTVSSFAEVKFAGNV